ncbi:aldehyde dehydrogenase family protein [Sporichthya brevicatena]|uniref:Aldehyde dehydrogenase family protein n=1 Tax=Sporichthya brevicatena TaxID=171442 RepID=A0ABN1H4K4_9ACTN
MTLTSPPLERLPKAGLLIGSDRVLSSSVGSIDHVYPGTGEVTGSVPLAGPAEIDQAVAAARSAFAEWRVVAPNVRRRAMLRLAALVREHAEELSELCIIENGTPRPFADSYPELVADLLEYNAGWTDKIGGEVVPTWPLRALDYTVEEPYGVVGILIPWNGPFGSAGMTMAPALAAGNCVVVKPPELAPWSVLRLGELALEAGFPPGVINVVPAGPVGGEALVRHRGVDYVHFTGSGVTARHILTAAAETLKPVGLELGGKSPRIIFPDADLQGAVVESIGNLAVLSGQGCIYGMRVLAHVDVYDQVVGMVQAFSGHIALGDPFAPTTQMGPVINTAARDRILGMVERAQAEGARLVAGGTPGEGDLARGSFVAPTVFADVAPGSELAREEVFGPVIAITPFSDEEEAVRLANDTDFGLAAYIWTNDLRRAHVVADRLEAGNVWINGFLGIPAGAPFGGHKQSGYGRLGGREGVREFTRTKNVYTPFDPLPSL